MSSHHFVKEGQEPDLLIEYIEDLQRPMLEALLEWSPKLVVSKPAAEKLNSWGIKIDAIWCSNKEVEDLQHLIQFQQPIDIIEKDILGFETFAGSSPKPYNLITNENWEAVFTRLCTSSSNHHISSIIGTDYYALPLKQLTFSKFYPSNTNLRIESSTPINIGIKEADNTDLLTETLIPCTLTTRSNGLIEIFLPSITENIWLIEKTTN